MQPGLAPAKISWAPILLTIGVGIFVAAVSIVGWISQWRRPSSPTAAVSFAGILLGLLILSAGCIWLLIKVLAVMSRSQ